MNAPEWWYLVSGLFFGLGTVFFIALIILAIILIQKQKGILDRVNALITKVDGITTKVDGLVTKANSLTERVGEQATGAAGNINAFTSAITQRAEWVSLAFIVLGALRGFLAGRKAQDKSSKR
ncbi:MAG: hypothetical protein JNK63_09490 [Chthonomonas sp.]|nr:hypothetical protein [Chthonomonas sp.]